MFKKSQKHIMLYVSINNDPIFYNDNFRGFLFDTDFNYFFHNFLKQRTIY